MAAKSNHKSELSLHNLKGFHPPKDRKRIGRGIGSGRGKTATAGHKGQRSRSGHKISATFEGGQMPFHRRIPKKRGFFSHKKKVVYQIVNLYQVERLKLQIVDHQTLLTKKLISHSLQPIKVLGSGELTSAVHFQVNAVSLQAATKIKLLQGKIDLI